MQKGFWALLFKPVGGTRSNYLPWTKKGDCHLCLNEFPFLAQTVSPFLHFRKAKCSAKRGGERVRSETLQLESRENGSNCNGRATRSYGCCAVMQGKGWAERRSASFQWPCLRFLSISLADRVHTNDFRFHPRRDSLLRIPARNTLYEGRQLTLVRTMLKISLSKVSRMGRGVQRVLLLGLVQLVRQLGLFQKVTKLGSVRSRSQAVFE